MIFLQKHSDIQVQTWNQLMGGLDQLRNVTMQDERERGYRRYQYKPIQRRIFNVVS